MAGLVSNPALTNVLLLALILAVTADIMLRVRVHPQAPQAESKLQAKLPPPPGTQESAGSTVTKDQVNGSASTIAKNSQTVDSLNYKNKKIYDRVAPSP